MIFKESGWSPNLYRGGFYLGLMRSVDELATCLMPWPFVIGEDSSSFHLMMEVISVRGY